MSSREKDIYIAVIGAGSVGSCFLAQLAQLAERQPSLRLRLCYIAIIDRALYHPDYSSIDITTALQTLDSFGSDLPSIPGTVRYLSTAPGKVIVADNTSSGQLAEAYPCFLRNGISIITPNKKAFSGDYQLWRDIFSCVSRPAGPLVCYESSVGAGMPIISTLNDLLQTGDQVIKIEGVFSGTMSFLFNSFSPIKGQGGKWSTEVRRARELRYTEPDPRDDLNGLDVARKLTILGRLAGLPIRSPTSFPVQSLIPDELQFVEDSDRFIDMLAEFDDRMEDERKRASEANKVIRYVGRVDVLSGQASVGMEWFDKAHHVAGLAGSDNIISFYTKRYGKTPLTIRGAGAGGEVTAMGILGDLLKVVSQIR